MAEPSRILRWTALWHERVGNRLRRLCLSLTFAAAIAAAHLAWRGTLTARASAAALIVFAIVLGISLLLRERRALSTQRGAIRRILLPIEPELGARALRAEALATRTASDPTAGSQELARTHFARVLDQVSIERVTAEARRRGTRLALVSLALVSAAFVAVAVEPMRVVEGFDVLASRRGVAPIPLRWLDALRVMVQPPAYLRAAEQAILPWGAAQLPEGSQIVVRGKPIRDGRKLVLTDGKTEVDFVDDGADGVVARWKLQELATLRVAARFGEVVILDPEALELEPVKDAVPEIELVDAPRTLSLKEHERIEFEYLVTDDHGLEQVELVLRSGAREERRTLLKLDGESKRERGAHALDARDAFLRRMFLPVIATIEARDNEKAKGERWGRSQPVTILPPAIGEPEGLRYAALESARDSMVALLDQQIETERLKKQTPPLPAAERKQRTATEKELVAEVLKKLDAVTSNAYAGARLSTGLSTFVLGQARALRSKDASRRRSEDVLLALDAALRGLGDRDAAEVAKRLADAADEVADGAKLALRSEKRTRGLERVALALGVLDDGSANLRRLSALGADLGSVAESEIRRIRRAEKAQSLSQVELVARHLAGRLRRPSPSFGSAGGNVESGKGAESPGPASEADKQFDQLMEELEQLAAQHAEQIRRVERSLEEADQSASAEELAAEAKEQAEKLRNALEDLPQTGAQAGSARAAAALAREHMSAMAQNLERLALEGAVGNGTSAKDQIHQAERLAADPNRVNDWLDRREIDGVKQPLDQALAWAEQALQRLRDKAAQNAARDLSEAAEREDKFAERASNLAGRGSHSEARLPEDVEDALERAESVMRDAARELASGRGEPGLELQREAQRLLERSSSGRTTDDSESQPQQNQRGRDGSQGRQMAQSGEVPAAEQAERAADFKKRVLDGLSKERRGRLSPAVERYAEGLLE